MSAVRATPLAADTTKAPGLRATPAASLDGAFAIELLSASAPATPVATPTGLAATPAPSPAPVSPLPAAAQLVPPAADPPVADPGETVAPVLPTPPPLDLGKPAPILPIDPPAPAPEDDAHKKDDSAQADVAALVGLPVAPPVVQVPVAPAPAAPTTAATSAAAIAPAASPAGQSQPAVVAPPLATPAPRVPTPAAAPVAADATDPSAPVVTAPIAAATVVAPVVARASGAASTAPAGSSTARVRVQRSSTDEPVPDTKIVAKSPDVNPQPTIAPSIITQQAAPVAPVSTTAATPPLAAQLAKPILTLQGSGAGTHILTIKVAPDSLGPVTVRAHLGGDGIRIELIAPTDQGRDAINAILPDLKRDLAQGGMQQTSLDVSTQSSASGTFSGNQNSTTAGGASEQGARRDSWAPRGDGARADQQAPVRTAAVGGTSLLDVYA